MSQFLTPFRGEQQKDGIHWDLTDWLVYDHPKFGRRAAPPGFRTDGGSIPSLAQGFINPYGKGLRGFVIHDLEFGRQILTFDECNELLRDALRDCGENWLDSAVQYRAVQDGGMAAWLEDQKNAVAIRAQIKLAGEYNAGQQLDADAHP